MLECPFCGVQFEAEDVTTARHPGGGPDCPLSCMVFSAAAWGIRPPAKNIEPTRLSEADWLRSVVEKLIAPDEAKDMAAYYTVQGTK